jgi:hypothetical protein
MQRKNVEKLYTDGNIDEATRDELLADIDLTNTADTVMAPEGSAYIYSLVPGDYSMDATLVHNGMIRIPEKTIEYCKGWDTGVAGICIGGWEEVKMPEQNISNWPKGGGQINFTLTESEVYGSNALILYVLEMPLPQTWDDMQNYQSIQDYEKNKLYTIRPEMR